MNYILVHTIFLNVCETAKYAMIKVSNATLLTQIEDVACLHIYT